MKELKLDGRDSALIFREDGKLEVHLATLKEDDPVEEVKNHEILTVALAELLKDEKFVTACVEQYEKNLQKVGKEL